MWRPFLLMAIFGVAAISAAGLLVGLTFPDHDSTALLLLAAGIGIAFGLAAVVAGIRVGEAWERRANAGDPR
jgi:hypothetical protein